MTRTAAVDLSVPLLDLKAQYDTIRAEVEPVIREVVESQWFIGGPHVDGVERAIAEYCGTTRAVGCASGSDALLLALMALGIGPGDEVICPSYTFFATVGTIHRLGARPVFVDIDPATYNIDPAGLARAVASCTKLRAIMPVHLFGRAADLDAILAIGAEHDVPVIEDAAQAIGTRDDRGAMAGSRGRIGCFSFFPSKNLGGFGDGGIVTTSDEALAHRMSILRNHGMDPKYHHAIVGLNARLDALQAAVLEVKLRHLESWHEGRAANADHYDRMFAEAGAPDSSVPLDSGDGLPLRTPSRPADPARHIFNQYVVRVPADRRDALRAHLQSHRIGTEVYYPVPCHLQPCFAFLGGREGMLPESERAARETIALPIYAELTAEQREHVAGRIIEFLDGSV